MSAQLVCTVVDVKPSDSDGWKVDIEFKIVHEGSSKKELTMVLVMGALLGNMGDPVFHKIIDPFVAKHWEDTLNASDLGMTVPKPKVIL
jgi:hypothetical protein